MTVGTYLIEVVLNPLAVGGLGTILAAAMAARALTHQRRLRRTLIHLRMEVAWKNARIRMYLVGPIGASHLGGTKYFIPPGERINASTNQEFLRYIGG
jgi:hypothetical protein